jgi:hypothetical protein
MAEKGKEHWVVKSQIGIPDEEDFKAIMSIISVQVSPKWNKMLKTSTQQN